jgi:hypothetical protein
MIYKNQLRMDQQLLKVGPKTVKLIDKNIKEKNYTPD